MFSRAILKLFAVALLVLYSTRDMLPRSKTTEVNYIHKINTSQIQKSHGLNKTQLHNLEALLYTVTTVVIDTVRVSPAILREVCHNIE